MRIKCVCVLKAKLYLPANLGEREKYYSMVHSPIPVQARDSPSFFTHSESQLAQRKQLV